MLWTLDYERPDGLLVVDYTYFEREQPTDLRRERARTSTLTWSSTTPSRTSGTTAWARSSLPCWRRGWN